MRLCGESPCRKDQQALEEAFAQVEREEMGEGVHERYHELAHRLGKE
ncbi:MAG: hypothetical protein N2508_04275 [Anaerolineae bacterium]|nr:hypothetical protein [Anaerolineae bacterium]